MSEPTFLQHKDNLSLSFAQLTEIDGEAVDAATSLTFPSHRALLRKAGQHSDDAIGLAALLDGTPIGLVLCRLPQKGTNQTSAELLSISVKSTLRRKGIARNLLTLVESELLSRSVQNISAIYTSSNESINPFQKLLESQSWSNPTPRILFCRGSVQRMYDEAPWIKRITCPDEFSVFDWRDLTLDEKLKIQNEIDTGIVPEELSPFYEEDTLELETSVGVRHEGKVVGWQINHPVPNEEGVLRYSRTFVYPEFQRTARGIVLIKEAIQRNVDRVIDKYPRFLSDVAYERPAMVRFYKRHLIPHSERSYSSYLSQKKLTSAG